MGECRNDYGGYFIINGKEKVILSQEKFADNMLYVRKYKHDELYSFSCEVHSVSEAQGLFWGRWKQQEHVGGDPKAEGTSEISVCLLRESAGQ